MVDMKYGDIKDIFENAELTIEEIVKLCQFTMELKDERDKKLVNLANEGLWSHDIEEIVNVDDDIKDMESAVGTVATCLNKEHQKKDGDFFMSSIFKLRNKYEADIANIDKLRGVDKL